MDANPGASIEQVREAAKAIMMEFGTSFGMAAGNAAYGLRSIVAEIAGVELPQATYEYAPEAVYADKTARYQVGKLMDGEAAGFVTQIAEASRYFAERGANDTMTHVGASDARALGKNVRFARVPTGATTCPYCLMLASRGFVYRSKLTALNANHRYCDCRIIEGFPGMEVEGYDPDKYYDMWKHPEKYPPTAPGTSSTSTPQWARNMNVSVSDRDVGLPAGQRNAILRTARCDVYTTYDGIEVIFPQGLDTTKPDMTPQHAIELLNRVPSEIRSNMQRQVFFVDYENPQDAYWRRRYRNFTRSYATGGDEITFYTYVGHDDDDYVVRSYCHEAGHYIDQHNRNVSGTKMWIDARTADMQTSGHS